MTRNLRHPMGLRHPVVHFNDLHPQPPPNPRTSSGPGGSTANAVSCRPQTSSGHEKCWSRARTTPKSQWLLSHSHQQSGMERSLSFFMRFIENMLNFCTIPISTSTLFYVIGRVYGLGSEYWTKLVFDQQAAAADESSPNGHWPQRNIREAWLRSQNEDMSPFASRNGYARIQQQFTRGCKYCKGSLPESNESDQWSKCFEILLIIS